MSFQSLSRHVTNGTRQLGDLPPSRRGRGPGEHGPGTEPRRAATRLAGRAERIALALVAAVVAVWLLVKAADDPRRFAVVTLNGLTLAALYFVVASGFTLIFGLMRVVNMAHGSLYLLGGYLALEMQEAWFKEDAAARALALRRATTRRTRCSPGSCRCCSRRRSSG